MSERYRTQLKHGSMANVIDTAGEDHSIVTADRSIAFAVEEVLNHLDSRIPTRDEIKQIVREVLEEDGEKECKDERTAPETGRVDADIWRWKWARHPVIDRSSMRLITRPSSGSAWFTANSDDNAQWLCDVLNGKVTP